MLAATPPPPPALTLTVLTPYVSPNRDGRDDRLRLRISSPTLARATLSLTGPLGATLVTRTLGVGAPRTLGLALPATVRQGVYVVVATAPGLVGASSPVDLVLRAPRARGT